MWLLKSDLNLQNGKCKTLPQLFFAIFPQFCEENFEEKCANFPQFCEENFEGRRGKPSEEGDGVVTYSKPTESTV